MHDFWILLLNLISYPAVIGQGCGLWRDYQDSSYMYVGMAKSWNDARDHCTKICAHLLSLHSKEEYTFVQSLICRSRDRLGASRFIAWTGARDDSDKTPTNEDGSKMDYLPENLDRNIIPGCMTIRAWREEDPQTYNDWKWENRQCSDSYPFICKKAVPRDYYGAKVFTVWSSPRIIKYRAHTVHPAFPCPTNLKEGRSRSSLDCAVMAAIKMDKTFKYQNGKCWTT